jgi:two-component system sensor histidine kinase HydH
MMHFMWGQRWGRPPLAPEGEGPPPPAIQDRKFWEGSIFGVAVGARSFPGVIAVHADADYVLNFRKEIGVEQQIEDIGRQAGVSAVALLDPDLVVVAHTDRARIGRRLDDSALAAAAREQRGLSRFIPAGGQDVFEVIRPIRLDGARLGLVSVAFSTEPMQRAWHRDLRAGLVLGASVLVAGALGLAGIFYVQQRYLRERSALEAAMARRERLAALGDVAAAFAHEVRNPLNAVSIGLQRLRAEFNPEPVEEYAQFVDLMQGEVRRLNAIVEEFIALARPLPVKPLPMDAADLVRETAALVEPEARQAGVDLRVTAPPSLPLRADHDHLKQVLLNLGLNAVQAMRETGGTLSIEAAGTRETVTLTVADTGPGIAPEALPRIFDPYFTTKRGGLGLGLTIARRIAEAHGGALDADSEPGRGARFRVSLPARPS